MPWQVYQQVQIASQKCDFNNRSRGRTLRMMGIHAVASHDKQIQDMTPTHRHAYCSKQTQNLFRSWTTTIREQETSSCTLLLRQWSLWCTNTTSNVFSDVFIPRFLYDQADQHPIVLLQSRRIIFFYQRQSCRGQTIQLRKGLIYQGRAELSTRQGAELSRPRDQIVGPSCFGAALFAHRKKSLGRSRATVLSSNSSEDKVPSMSLGLKCQNTETIECPE